MEHWAIDFRPRVVLICQGSQQDDINLCLRGYLLSHLLHFLSILHNLRTRSDIPSIRSNRRRRGKGLPDLEHNLGS